MCQQAPQHAGLRWGRQAARNLLPSSLVPRLLALRPWLGLAFLASAGICCLNPQPEPPTESATASDPGDRGSDGGVGNGDPSGGKGDSGSGGTSDGESGGAIEPPPDADPDPDDHSGQGGSGDFGNGSGGTTGAAAGGPGAGGPDGAAGAGGSASPPDVPGHPGGAGGSGTDEGEDCNSCSEVLERGGNPCPGAVAKLTALVGCCHEACGACKERIVRGDRVGGECTQCLAEACGEALEACKAD